MLKVEELRIGNFVNATFQGKAKIETVVDICNGLINPWTHEGIENNMQAYSGIPLTEEWLSKFDLDIVSFADFGFTTKSHGHEYVIEQQGDWFFIGIRPDETQTTYFAWNIYYVHQLQNLIFALTGKELTIKPQ